MKIIFTIIALLALPAVSFAWGFETHITIGLNILETTTVDIIRQNPAYFLCGNIFPDLFNLFKDFSKFKQNLPTHQWSTVSKMFAQAQCPEEQAFAYGYSSHLSADIIAHNNMVPQHIAYVDSGRMRSHLILEMAEESLHVSRQSRLLPLLLKHSPIYGALFLRTMNINQAWFEREAGTIRIGVISQKKLMMQRVTGYIKKKVQPNFEERCGYFREAALKNAHEAVENGYSTLAAHDPSGRDNMEKAREIRREMLKNNSKKALKKEYNEHIDQRIFSLTDSDT